MMKKMLSPSMMCADISALTETLSEFEKSGIEYLHIDVMDGVFVPNYALGTDYCRRLRKLTHIPLDIHLMVTEPEKKLGFFDFGKGDVVSFHVEAAKEPEKIIEEIRSRGASVFIALNPETPISSIGRFIPDADGILVMTVHPGFAGQKMVPGSLEKIAEVRALLEKGGMEDKHIEVDGNVSFVNGALMSKAGADIFVGGSSSVFSKDMDTADAIKKFRSVL